MSNRLLQNIIAIIVGIVIAAACVGILTILFHFIIPGPGHKGASSVESDESESLKMLLTCLLSAFIAGIVTFKFSLGKRYLVVMIAGIIMVIILAFIEKFWPEGLDAYSILTILLIVPAALAGPYVFGKLARKGSK